MFEDREQQERVDGIILGNALEDFEPGIRFDANFLFVMGQVAVFPFDQRRVINVRTDRARRPIPSPG